MDPLSLAANIAGVIIPALHGMRLLLRDLQDIKDAPDSVRDLQNELILVDGALSSLQAINPEDLSSLGSNVENNVKSTIDICSTACEEFRADLQRWTRHSKLQVEQAQVQQVGADGSESLKLSWRDRSIIGFWKLGHIKSIQGKIQNCQVNITSVVSTATLYSSFQHTQITEEIRRTLSAKEVELKVATETADQQRGLVESQLERLNVEEPEPDIEEYEPEETARVLEEERIYLDMSRRLLSELLEKVQEAAKSESPATPVVNVTFGNQNSGLQIATNNAPMTGFVFGGKG